MMPLHAPKSGASSVEGGEPHAGTRLRLGRQLLLLRRLLLGRADGVWISRPPGHKGVDKWGCAPSAADPMLHRSRRGSQTAPEIASTVRRRFLRDVSMFGHSATTRDCAAQTGLTRN